MARSHLVFTSPPYFRAESYSDDENQSDKKFPIYDEWRDGSLLPTLKTAVEWLKRGRFLLWNIADTKDGGAYVPLEYDSKAILEDLGMQYETKLEIRAVPFARREPIGRRGVPRDKELLHDQWALSQVRADLRPSGSRIDQRATEPSLTALGADD